MRKISAKFALYLGEKQNLDKNKIDVLRFGIETFLTMLFGYGAILAVAYLLGILKETVLFCIITYFLRIFSGGGHCSTWQRCTLAGAFFVPLVVLLSQKIIITPNSLSIIWWSGFILLFFLILKYAPRDNPAKPIVTLLHKKRLKVLSIIFTLLMLIISLFLSSALNSIIFYGLIWQILSITPIGLNFINFVDMGLKKIGI